MRLIKFLDDILIIAASKGEMKAARNPINISPAVTRFFDKYNEIGSPVPTVDKI